MSLYSKSKNILFQKTIDKVVKHKNSLNQKLKNISLEKIDQYLAEQEVLESVLRIFTNEHLICNANEKETTLQNKIDSLKKIIPLRRLSILSITYNPKVIKMLYSEYPDKKDDMSVILDIETADQLSKMDEDSPENIALLEKKIYPLLQEEEKYLNVKLVRYRENLDVVFLYDIDTYKHLSSELDKCLLTIIKKVLEPKILSLAASLFVEEDNDQYQDYLFQGFKHFFLYQKQRDFDKSLSDLLYAFGLTAFLVLERVDTIHETYQLSSHYGMEKNIKLGGQFDILELLGAHKGNSDNLKEKIFKKMSRRELDKVVFIQSIFLGGPEKIIMPIKMVFQDEFVEKSENLKKLESLLKYHFLVTNN